MSFSPGQLRQLGNALEAADWTAADMTLMGQAGRDRLVGFRDSLRRGGDIVAAIIEGRTELWLAPGQNTGSVEGRDILNHLAKTDLLASCTDLEELKAVQAKGVEFFRQNFTGKFLHGWRGVQGEEVPYLSERSHEVLLNWRHLDEGLWADNCPALRRK